MEHMGQTLLTDFKGLTDESTQDKPYLGLYLNTIVLSWFNSECKGLSLVKIALQNKSAAGGCSIQLKPYFVKCMYKAFEHDYSTLMYVTKLPCHNHISVIGWNWHDCVNVSEDISMIGMNVKQV